MDGRSRLDRYQNLRSGMNRNDNVDNNRTQSNSFDNTDSFTSLNRNYQRQTPVPTRQASEYDSMLKEHEDFLKSLDEQFDNLNKGEFSQTLINGSAQPQQPQQTQPSAANTYPYTPAGSQYGNNAYNGYPSSYNNAYSANMAAYEQQPNNAQNYTYPQKSSQSAQDIMQQNSIKQIIENQRFAIPDVKPAQPQSLNMFTAPETKVASAFAQDKPIEQRTIEDTHTNQYAQNLYSNAQTAFAAAAFESVSNKPAQQFEQPQGFAQPQQQTLSSPYNAQPQTFAQPQQQTFNNPFNIQPEQPKLAQQTPAYEQPQGFAQPQQPDYNNPYTAQPQQQTLSNPYNAQPQTFAQPQQQTFNNPFNIQPEQPKPAQQAPAYEQPQNFAQPQQTVISNPMNNEPVAPQISVVADDEVYPYDTQQTPVAEQPKQAAQVKPVEATKPAEVQMPAETVKQEETQPLKEDFSIDDISSLVGETAEPVKEAKTEESVSEQSGTYDDFDSYINDVLSGFDTEEKKEPEEPVKPDVSFKQEVQTASSAKDERVSIEDKIPGIFFVDDDKSDDINSIKKEISGWNFKEDEFAIPKSEDLVQPQLQEEIKPSNAIESPIYYDDPKNINELTVKLNKEQTLNDELLEKTRALDYKVSEYQNEVEDANKENSKLGRILNLVLTLLILLLFAILFVIGFWFVNERGLSL